jgi:hypothetical protein
LESKPDQVVLQTGFIIISIFIETDNPTIFLSEDVKSLKMNMEIQFQIISENLIKLKSIRFENIDISSHSCFICS